MTTQARTSSFAAFRRREIWILLIVLLLAFALRVWLLHLPEPTGDEGFSYVFTKFTIPEMLVKTVEMIEPHPIGYYVYLKGWMALAGSSEFPIRFSSVIFGTFLVALVWRFARQLGLHRIHPAIPILAATLMAVNPFAVHYSREIRMYAVHMVLTLASMMLMLQIWRKPNWKWVAAYVLVSWTALQVHYYAGFVFIAQNVFFFGMALFAGLRKHIRPLAHWIAAEAIVLLASLPWIIFARTVLFNYRGNDVRGAALDDIVIDLIGNYTISKGHPDWHLPAALVAFLLMGLGLWHMWRAGKEHRPSAWLLLLYFVVPVLAGWLAAQGRPIYTARYFIATLTPFLVMIAVALSALIPTRRLSLASDRLLRGATAVLSVALAGILTAGMIWDFRIHVTEKPPDWRNFVAVVDRFTSDLPASQYRPVLNYPNPTFTYFYDDRGEYITLPYEADDLEGSIKVVEQLKDAGVKRLVFQQFKSWWDDTGVAETAMSKEYTQIDEAWTGAWLAKIYSRMDAAELQPVNATFSDGVTLSAAHVRPDLAARLVEIGLNWQSAPAQLSGSEKMFIHITPANDPTQVPAQLDLPLTVDNLARPVNLYGIRLPENLAPGQYIVRIGLYDPSLPNAPRLLTRDGKDAVELMTFEVK
jgi:hypothetical protein